ncbi:MAG TPA: extracellular solute-binding protein [Dehalococcoidia bacterium]
MSDRPTSPGTSRQGIRSSRQGRRGFLTVMGGAGAALLAAACGGDSTTKPVPSATTAAIAPSLAGTAASRATAAPAAVATTPSGPVKVSTVTYLDADTAPEEVAWHKKFEADFQAAFPQYRAEGSHYSNSADYLPKLQTTLATNSPLEMIWKDGNSTVDSLWDQGLLAPVNDVMEDVYKSIGGKDKFDQTVVDRYTLPTGELIGVPYTAGFQVYWYRTDLLKEAGLTPPADHWDWNFLLKAAKATHKPPQVYGVATPLGRNSSVVFLIGAFILNNGGHFVSQDLKDVVFDSPEVREAVDMIKELAQYAPPGATTWVSADQVNAIVHGGVAMGQYQGRVLANLITMNPAIMKNFGNTIIPYQKDPRTYGTPSAHGLFKGSSKNLAGAKELAKFGMHKDQMISWMRTAPGYYTAPVTAYNTDSSYLEDPVLKAYAYDPSLLATIAKVNKYAYDFAKEGPGWNVNAKGGTLTGSLFLADVVQKVVIGKESTASAVTWGAGQIRDIMKG